MDNMESEFSEAVGALFKLQEKFDEYNVQLNEEITKLQAGYEHKKRGVYEERDKLIARIPNFWQRAIENHMILSDLIDVEDALAMDKLTGVEVVRDAENPLKYKIIFRFDENDLFTNRELVQNVDVTNKDEPTLSTETIIEWKGKNLLSKSGSEGQAAKKAASSNGKHPEFQNEDEEDDDEDATFFKFFTADGDVQLAEIIADDFYPNSVNYFRGSEDDDDEMDYVEDEQDLGEGEEEEEEEEEEAHEGDEEEGHDRKRVRT